jgi:hypothetical protein
MSFVQSSGNQRSKPLRNGFLEMTQVAVIEDGHLAIRDVQVAVGTSRRVVAESCAKR